MEGYGATLDTPRVRLALARGDLDEVEDEAPRHARRQNYLRSFALRALGRVRGDEALVREALAEFEAYGLGWFAAETRATL